MKMALRSHTLRMARALASKELCPTVQAGCVTRRHRQLHCISTGTAPSAPWGVAYRCDYFRSFSAKPEEAAEPQSSEGEAPPPPPADGDAAEKDATEASGAAEGGVETEVSKLESQVKELKDNLLRSLAEQENTRRIARRDVANAKSFAISSFAKSLLESSDNLSRALDAVPEEMRHDHENHPVLANLYEGISMTDDGLAKAFAKNGLTKFGEKGEKFDPNLHEALFEYPDPEGEAGSVGQVMKVGFMLNDRVLRPAEVGVVKNP